MTSPEHPTAPDQNANAADESSPRRRWGVVELFVIAGIVVVLLALLFPAVNASPRATNRALTESECRQLATAIKLYFTEYGKWPLVQDGGAFLDDVSQRKLINVLQGNDPIENPRKIVFYEARRAWAVNRFWQPERYVQGLHPKTGVLLDSWGNPFRVVVDADYDGKINSPYTDEPPVPSGVIVWSLGRDGKQGWPTEPVRLRSDGQRADDVTSWGR